jgi:Ca-activated chloride channel family protein
MATPMSLASPWWLVVGLVVVAGLIAGARTTAHRRRIALAAAGLDRPSGRRAVQLGLWLSIAGLAVLTIAAARPTASLPVARAAGTVILTMDVSNSMSATDVAPSRLGAAQKAATAFVDAQPDSVDIGVVAFENGGLTTDQPSPDHGDAQAAIARLRVTGGTSLADAILTSLSAITHKTVSIGPDGVVPSIGYWGSATIVMFSDGEDRGSDAATEAAADAAEAAGVHIETVGVGTTAGATVSVDGFRVHSALDAAALTAIAQTTGGTYHSASRATELDSIASKIDLRLTRHKEDVPLAGAFLGLAVLLLAAGAVLTVFRTGRVV